MDYKVGNEFYTGKGQSLMDLLPKARDKLTNL